MQSCVLATSLPTLSLVIPCYNEEEVIEQTHRSLLELAKQISKDHGLSLELIYVNDGSKDKTLGILHALAQKESSSPRESSSNSQNSHAENSEVMPCTQTRVISFSRNFGHQAAIAAGLMHAKGQWIATIDADLQDPPALLSKMLSQAKTMNSDVVHGQRSSRIGETAFKRLTAFCFYRFLNWISGGNSLKDVGDFRLMSRRVVDAINGLPERSLYLRGLLPELGFRQSLFPYERPARAAGETKYTLSKMMRLAFEGITAVSVAPLKVGLAFGLFTAFICVLYVTAIIILKVIDPNFAVRGWPSMMVIILFLGAVQLLTLGIIGEYLGQIHREVKQRPRFFVDEKESLL